MNKKLFFGLSCAFTLFAPIMAMEEKEIPSKEENNKKLIQAVLSFGNPQETSEEILRLLRAGANPDEIITEGDQRDFEVQRGDRSSSDEKSSVSLSREGYTLLEFAIANGNEKLVMLLVVGVNGNKAEINRFSGKLNGTPLHTAIKSGFQSIIKHLLEANADPQKANSDGLNARQYAENSKADQGIIDLFRPEVTRSSRMAACENCMRHALTPVCVLALLLVLTVLLAPSEM